MKSLLKFSFIKSRDLTYHTSMVPQELFDMILDFLHNDVAALRNAGLVCKSWLPTSRFHLFSEIYWDLTALIHNGLEVICAKGSTIPPYILKLRIEGDESQILNETLIKLPLLSNVKRLQLSQIRMENLKLDAKMKLITMLPNLTTLELSAVTVRNYFSLSLDSFWLICGYWILGQFESVDRAVDFVASAPCLEDIGLSNVRCSKSCDYSSRAFAPPLRRIRFEPGPLVDNLMDWFCRSRPTPNVHTLDINRLALDDNIPTVCNLIRHLGSALEHLMISCTDSHGEVRSKYISDSFFINASLITWIY